ncbi:Mo-dependent nitrogenase C-terminal domain-containing protein [Thermosynechococcus sp. HN-54]|uniref:Mo-dependent nitrogenase C-terminal domain-containing protein n=1 Tax=Thermosynechococcus sp. HN-54 TaxID=2933959 RepID=UPI00202CC630|nr:Mo-dependent nitrogenase C-terminal domain-containing protein [Thermosynechococcus sp. HN-54]URR35347.1 Mo-dependent nitrogenase C-terminal domain-containing protein [Thermosynechococcus sp. HN-54]
MTIFTFGQRLLRTLLWPLRQWLEHLEVHDRQLAHRLCRLIPAQCPFERDIVVAKWHIHIPPLCHLNPLYEELMVLRYRALCYLADECHEDISAYC